MRYQNALTPPYATLALARALALALARALASPIALTLTLTSCAPGGEEPAGEEAETVPLHVLRAEAGAVDSSLVGPHLASETQHVSKKSVINTLYKTWFRLHSIELLSKVHAS